MSILAVNKKYQTRINKVVTVLTKYNVANKERDNFERENEFKQWNRFNNICEKFWDKFEDLLSELPKGEQRKVLKSKLYLLG
tara:strand:+ start:136 stop:381 length:246 start_codon:yes stop_codon:yes gene_type:complete